MSLTEEAAKRIIRDTKILQLCPLHQEGIFIIPDSNNIQLVRCLIIGPDDTPYENGFYFYEITFPDNYPYSPPKAVFYTNDGKKRMHPNFYSNGKVCVSLIGTWSGPGWTSCNTLSSVLNSFRSIMVNNPLWQEPGFNGENTSRNQDYNDIINYENYRIAIIQMYSSTPYGFECFNDIMNEWLIKYKTKIVERLELLSEKHRTIRKNVKEIRSPAVYSFVSEINYMNLINQLNIIYKNIPKDRYSKELNDLVKAIPKDKYISSKKLFKSIDTGDVEPLKLTTLLDIIGKIKRNPQGHMLLL